jgi:integrase
VPRLIGRSQCARFSSLLRCPISKITDDCCALSADVRLRIASAFKPHGGSPQPVAILKASGEIRRVRIYGVKPGQSLSNMAVVGLLKDVKRDKSGEPRWVHLVSGCPITLHGLRATFRTWGEDAGCPRDLLEESLGHQIGTAVERAYRRTDTSNHAGLG